MKLVKILGVLLLLLVGIGVLYYLIRVRGAVEPGGEDTQQSESGTEA